MSWFEIQIDADDNDTYLVAAPAFPEVTTYGDNVEDSLINGRRAIEEAIAARISAGDVVPPPSSDKEENRPQYAVQLPMLTFLKAALYSLCKVKNVTPAELGRRLGWHREQVDRLFRIGHKSQLGQLEEAFKAIDVELSSPVPEFDERSMVAA